MYTLEFTKSEMVALSFAVDFLQANLEDREVSQMYGQAYKRHAAYSAEVPCPTEQHVARTPAQKCKRLTDEQLTQLQDKISSHLHT